MIALVTDSGSQLPPELRERFAVGVAPLTVVLDQRAYHEGVDTPSNEAFYLRVAEGAAVSTAAPSPGAFVRLYKAAAAAGASAVLSIHTGSNLSSTIGAASIAARTAPCPVEIVDSGMVSFPVACCVWAAGVARERGAALAEAAATARTAAQSIDSVSVIGAPKLAERGGRLPVGVAMQGGVPLVALRADTIEVVDHVHDADAAVETMVAYFRTRANGRRHRVGVGHGAALGLADELAGRLAGLDEVTELVRYEVGPSVGAHTGPGTAGCVFFPDELMQEAAIGAR